MLSGIRVYSSNSVWRQILDELGATVLNAPNILDINIDKLKLDLPISVLNLKSEILSALEYNDVMRCLFKDKIPQFSNLQKQIIVAIYRTHGASVIQLQELVGLAPDAATHVIDTAIYQIRKIVGHEFIQNKNGKYIIGKL